VQLAPASHAMQLPPHTLVVSLGLQQVPVLSQ